MQLIQIAAICTRMGKSFTDFFATSEYLLILLPQTHLDETNYDIIYERGRQIENLTH